MTHPNNVSSPRNFGLLSPGATAGAESARGKNSFLDVMQPEKTNSMFEKIQNVMGISNTKPAS